MAALGNIDYAMGCGFNHRIYAVSIAFLVMTNTAPSGDEYGWPYSGYHVFVISLSVGIWVIGVPLAAVLGIVGFVRLPDISGREVPLVSVYSAALFLGPLMMVMPH